MGTEISADIFSGTRFAAWQEAYEAAVRSTRVDDPSMDDLFRLIEIAEPAMLIRRDQLRGHSGNDAEQLAIEEALYVLATIKRELLKF